MILETQRPLEWLSENEIDSRFIFPFFFLYIYIHGKSILEGNPLKFIPVHGYGASKSE